MSKDEMRVRTIWVWVVFGLLALTAKNGLSDDRRVSAAEITCSNAIFPCIDSYGTATNPFALPSGTEPPILLAHAILVKELPAKETVVTDAPQEVLLTFNEGVGTEFLALAVVDDTGKRVDKHDARLDFTDHSHLRASVENLLPGRYLVRYRVLSADGHVVSGKYFFNVKAKQ